MAILLISSPVTNSLLETYYSVKDKSQEIILQPFPFNKEPTKKELQEFIDECLSDLEGIDGILCTLPKLFKQLTGNSKAAATLGYVLEYKSVPTAYIPSYKAIMYDPEANQPKVDFAIQQLLSKISGNYTEPGKELKITQLKEETSIKEFLDKNLSTDLSVDIETTGLKHFDSEIVSISFGLSSTEAIAFLITPEIKPILKNYFLNRTGKNIYHNASFDVYMLIYHLFMEHSLDYPGLLSGLDVMLYNYEDTMLIAYLATNTCAGATLGLKDLVATSFGDYAEDVTDVTSLTVDTLLTYNGKDTCATWEVWDTYHPKVLEDQQKELYETIFKDAQKDIIQMQLSGMPVDMDRVLEVDQELNQLANGLLESINSSSIVKEVTQLLREEWAVKKNKTLKVKRVTSNDSKLEFNPNSDDHIRKICYTLNDLPVIETTATGLASVGGEILHQLSQQTTGELQELLKNLADLSKIDKIITSFIPALKASHRAKDGWHYLYGNFKLGGTVSGRLSSNSPSLQNLPANSIYGKLIKSCFKAPEGWLFVGIDFNSLEDRISALTTKDDNKLKVYIENYDGHCLRAYSYFGDQMPDIELATSEEKCYTANIGSTDIYFKAGDTVVFDGIKYSGEKFYDLCSNKTL